MDRALLGRFVRLREMLDDRDYLAAAVVFAAAPTLAGIKPATLLSFTDHGRDLKGLWGRYRDDLSARLTLDYLELVQAAASTLVLFYRRGMLERLLSDRKIAPFLMDLGYETGMSLAERL